VCGSGFRVQGRGVGFRVVAWGGALSYERGTPVHFGPPILSTQGRGGRLQGYPGGWAFSYGRGTPVCWEHSNPKGPTGIPRLHKKTPSPKTRQQTHAWGPTVVPGVAQFLMSEVPLVGPVFDLGSRKVDVRLPGKGNSNSHDTRPVHLIITMIKWIRTIRLSIKNSLPPRHSGASGACGVSGLRTRGSSSAPCTRIQDIFPGPGRARLGGKGLQG